jgi:hypothetical protein
MGSGESLAKSANGRRCRVNQDRGWQVKKNKKAEEIPSIFAHRMTQSKMSEKKSTT